MSPLTTAPMEDVGAEVQQRLHSLEAGVADGVLQHAPPVLVTRREESSFLDDESGAQLVRNCWHLTTCFPHHVIPLSSDLLYHVNVRVLGGVVERRAAALVPLVDVLDLLEDGVAHALPHAVQVAVARVRQDALLVGRGHPQRREARLAGRDVAVAAHPADLAAVLALRWRR